MPKGQEKPKTMNKPKLSVKEKKKKKLEKAKEKAAASSSSLARVALRAGFGAPRAPRCLHPSGNPRPPGPPTRGSRYQRVWS